MASVIALASGQVTVGDVMTDVKNYNFFNKSETNVPEAKVFSSYKGTPVIKFNSSAINSFSISNTLFINNDKKNDNIGVNTVKHEWGHTVQQTLIGTPKYISQIAVPSLICCVTVRDNSKIYYSLSCERSADFFGEAEREHGYYPWADISSGTYLVHR